MALQLFKKLKYFRNYEGKGEPLTTSFLEKKGISRQLIHSYIKNEWLKSIGFGAYTIPGVSITWQGVIRSLQQQLNLPIHVGAKTIFYLMNKAHYLGKEKIYLFCPRTTSIPQWVAKLDCFQERQLIIYQGNPILDWKLGMISFEDMRISSLERAILEQISLIGKTESFDETFKLCETLTTIQSALLSKLLVKCRSKKTRRIFLYFAEELNYSWFKKLIVERFDLGKGPRQIVKNGIYNRKYNIVVPKKT